MSIRVSVAVPTLGRESLWPTLRSLERQTVRPYEVLVVNQGSDISGQLAKLDLPTRLIQTCEKGVARARNAALDEFTGDWVLFTDDDQEANAEWIEQLTALAQAFPEASLMGGVVLPPVRVMPDEYVSECYAIGETLIDRSNHLTPSAIAGYPLDVWGGNCAFSRLCVDRVGRFDVALGRGSGYFTAGEDTDYVMRAITSGLTALLSCRLVVVHTHGARPRSNDLWEEACETSAMLVWKARHAPEIVAPELAERLFPYGRKKAALHRMTGGRAFASHGDRKRVFESALAKLDAEWTLKDGMLARLER